jgi:hypothetical protein
VFVPDENFFELPFGASFAPDPIFGKFPEVLVLSHGTFAVGIAEGAIMDLVELVGAGVKQLFFELRKHREDCPQSRHPWRHLRTCGPAHPHCAVRVRLTARHA